MRRTSNWLRSLAPVRAPASSRLPVFRLAVVLVMVLSVGQAAELKPETAAAWDRYLRSLDAKMQERLRPDGRFLWLDDAPDRVARVRRGEIVTVPIETDLLKLAPAG